MPAPVSLILPADDRFDATNYPFCNVVAKESSSSSDSVSSGDTDEAAAVIEFRKKRQREYAHQYYRRHKNQFAPIYKRDIRRQYGAMFANVLNSSDFSMFRNFFNRFSAKECDCKHIFHVAPVVQQLFPTAVGSSLVDQLVLHVAYVFATMPDLTARLADCKIIQSTQERGSKVSMTIHFTGTRIYEIDCAGAVPRLQSAVAAGLSQETADPSAAVPALPYFNEATVNRMRVPADPLLLNCDSTFVFTLDEQNNIVSWEQHWCTMDMSLPCGVAPPVVPYAETPVPDIFPLSSHPMLPAELTASMDLCDDFEG